MRIVITSITVGMAVFGLSFNVKLLNIDSAFRNVKYNDKI